MSDNKKYYYLKLKDNYFERDNVRVLESMENGHLYSLIILKLYLKSLKHEGHLKMTDKIPYSLDKVNVLAKVINHDLDHVKQAINLAVELDLISLMATDELWMTDIQNFIGHSSTEADRIREYRHKISTKDVTIVQQKNDISTPELKKESEKEQEKEIDTEKEKAFNQIWDLYGYKVSKPSAIKAFRKVPKDQYGNILKHVPTYIKSTPDKKFRKHLSTYLNNECWHDEIITATNDKETEYFIKQLGAVRV